MTGNRIGHPTFGADNGFVWDSDDDAKECNGCSAFMTNPSDRSGRSRSLVSEGLPQRSDLRPATPNDVGGGGCWSGCSSLGGGESGERRSGFQLAAAGAAALKGQYHDTRHTSRRRKRDTDKVVDDDDDDMATSLSKALAKLSVHARNAITEEIHGVVTSSQDDIETDQKYVNESVHQLHEELRKIPTKRKKDYRRACLLAPTKYESNRKFDLMFLRSTRFDPRMAAEKMVSFFKLKAELFGTERVAQDIKFEDLSEEDQAALHSDGCVIFLPLPDMAGRKIMFGTASSENPLNKARADFYQMMKYIEEDETVQKNGLIVVAYDVGVAFAKHSKCILNLITAVYEYLPYKVTCFHYCYSNPAIQATFTVFFRFLKKYINARFREHYGNHVEAQVRTTRKTNETVCLSVL